MRHNLNISSSVVLYLAAGFGAAAAFCIVDSASGFGSGFGLGGDFASGGGSG